MANDKVELTNKCIQDNGKNGGFGRCLPAIGTCFVVLILSFGIKIPADAITVTVQMDGTNQAIKGLDGNPVPTGEVIQIICASGETIHGPGIYGGASGGDRIIWSGPVGQGGLGDGAFIRDFAGSQSLTDESQRIYVRAWNGPSLVLSDHYGDSQLSTTIEVGEPPMPIEWSVPSFEISTIFTPEASNLMQIVAVWINGVKFRSGDIISSRVSMEVIISSEVGTDVTSTLLRVDNIPMYPPFTLVSGTPTYGKWYGSFTMPQSSQQRRLFTFHMEDISSNACEATMEARVLGGAVQVVGGTYNFPNPFSPMSGVATTIQYTLSRDAGVTIIIYDITGHEAKRMKFSSGTNGARGGTNQVSWNGRALGGEVAGNGMYVYKIISGSTVIGSGKLVVLD
jgi:hypothetical protein